MGTAGLTYCEDDANLTIALRCEYRGRGGWLEGDVGEGARSTGGVDSSVEILVELAACV